MSSKLKLGVGLVLLLGALAAFAALRSRPAPAPDLPSVVELDASRAVALDSPQAGDLVKRATAAQARESARLSRDEAAAVAELTGTLLQAYASDDWDAFWSLHERQGLEVAPRWHEARDAGSWAAHTSALAGAEIDPRGVGVVRLDGEANVIGHPRGILPGYGVSARRAEQRGPGDVDLRQRQRAVVRVDVPMRLRDPFGNEFVADFGVLLARRSGADDWVIVAVEVRNLPDAVAMPPI